MPYAWDDQARREAADYPVSKDQISQLREQHERKVAELGPDGVRDHKVSLCVQAWDEPPSLPDSFPRADAISRGDVLDIGEQVREKTLPAVDLLVASFVWGWGPVGYGPHRLREIRAAAGDNLEPALQRVLAAISGNAGPPDPIAGYAYLYGGYDHKKRAAPGTEPWSRLRGYGPAFFTKFLYFFTPATLILDNRMANAVHRLVKIPGLVTDNGHSLPWTPYRYAVYLHWMRQTAHAIGIEPDMLELTLFQPPSDVNDEHDAAD
jgi:hypothetical protein